MTIQNLTGIIISNLYNNPGDIAARGLEKFDTLKNNAETLVTKMRDSIYLIGLEIKFKTLL